MAEMKDLPPLIQELLKKKGWPWPPDEKLKAQFRETIKNAAGSIHTDPSILEELYREFGWTYHARRKT
jgi:hypothetical protein